MPTPPDPSGQNKPTNPLLGPPGKSTEMKADVIVNTSSAQIAFADLEQLFKKLIKSMGNDWDDVTNENLKKQERMYRALGKKDEERRAMLTRLKNETLAGIDEETNKKLAALDIQLAAEKDNVEKINQLKQQKISLEKGAEKQKKDIEQATDQQIKSEHGIMGHVQGIASKVGGPIGGMISGVAEIMSNPSIAVPAAILVAADKTLQRRAEFTKSGLQLAGAGLGEVGEGGSAAQGRATGLNRQLFADLDQALSSAQQQAIMGTMAGSRTMISQTQAPGGIEAIRKNLGLFANILPDASKEMEIFTDATKSLGMSQEDISKTFFQSSKNSKDLRITHLDALETQIEMQKALRNITNDGTVAASVLNNVGSFFRSIGKSETETQRMTLGVASAGANLSLSSIVGMLGFTRGIGPTSPEMEKALLGTNGQGGMLGGKTGVFGLMGEFFSKVGSQFKNPMERLFAAESLNKDFGLGIQTQDLPKFFKLSEQLRSGGLSQEDYATQVADLSKAGKTMSIEGMSDLVKIVGPMDRIANKMDNFWSDANSLFTTFFGEHGPVKNPYDPKNMVPPGSNQARKNIQEANIT